MTLPEGYQFVHINNINNDVYEFLKENYIEDDNNKYRYDYKLDFLQWYNNINNNNNYYNISINYNNNIVGFISGKLINLIINKHVEKTAEINFLCISKQHRSKQLCPLLINELKKQFDIININEAIFTSDTKLNYYNNISHVDYFVKVLNIKKLIECKYINTSTSLQVLENAYKLPKLKLGNKQLIKLDNNNASKYIEKCFNLYNKYFEQFDCYEYFNIDEFYKHFINNYINIYVLIEYDKVIDFISYYTINSIVLMNNYNIHDSYLYYYSNISNNFHKMILMLLYKLVENNIDTFIALNIMENNNDTLDGLSFIKKSTNFNYFLFKNSIKIPNNKIAKILF